MIVSAQKSSCEYIDDFCCLSAIYSLCIFGETDGDGDSHIKFFRSSLVEMIDTTCED